MRETVNVVAQKVAHAQQCQWQDITQPGTYVDVGTGDLYRFPQEAVIQGSSPVIRRETLEAPVLVQLSRDPFIRTLEARMMAAEHNIKPNF